MFNTPTGEEELKKAAIGLTVDVSGISDEDHREKNNGDYKDHLIIKEPVTFNVLRMEEDKWAVNVSFLHSYGADVTKKLKGDSFGSIGLSLNGSGRLGLYQRLVNTENIGIATGPFVAIHNRQYYKSYSCYDDPCDDFRFAPDEVSSLLNVGLRSRFLLRTSERPSMIVTGALDTGWIVDIVKPFIAFSFSITSF